MFPIWDNMPGRLTRKTIEFLIHAPHSKAMIGRHHQLISTHAPRMGSDSKPQESGGDEGYFNPRSPYGERRPGVPLRSVVSILISTHAPRIGSDVQRLHERSRSRDFNPRSPYGERPPDRSKRPDRNYFNPRSPYGERPSPTRPTTTSSNFNPRSLYGERRSSPGSIRGRIT